MMQLLETMLFFAIVLFLVEHDRPRAGLHLVDEDDEWATGAADRSETSSRRPSRPPRSDEGLEAVTDFNE